MKHLCPHAQPDFPGLLTSEQQAALVTVQSGLLKIDKAIKRINGLIVDNRLRLPTVQAPSVGLVYGETVRLVFCHELAEQKLRRAVDAPEARAA